MSLNYGIKEGNKYDTEIKVDKDINDFYHNNLPFLLMSVDVGEIQKDTIESIVKRLRIVSESWHKQVVDFAKKYEQTIEEFLERFIGYETNVATLSLKDFAQKRVLIILRDVPEIPEKYPDMWSGNSYNNSWCEYKVKITKQKEYYS